MGIYDWTVELLFVRTNVVFEIVTVSNSFSVCVFSETKLIKKSRDGKF